MNQLQRVARLLLDSQRPVHSLRPEVLELTRLLSGVQTVRTARQESISDGETQTSNGLAISPTMAAMCAEDFVRMIVFIRGIHAAIVDLRKRWPARPARVLYVGCGPWATLAVPLMAVFSSTEATFTLLDVHPESVASAQSIVATLGLASSVKSFEAVDATSYRVSPDAPPDILLIETMQACLETEPQVAITRHLLKQSPHAILIPQEVRIDLTLVDSSREFDWSGGEQIRDFIQRDRIPVGPVFVVSRQSLPSWEGTCPAPPPASIVRIPVPLEARYQPLLFTTIQVYESHVLRDYDSGLTCPRPPSIAGAIKPGDTLQFQYELGTHPRLCGKVIERRS